MNRPPIEVVLDALSQTTGHQPKKSGDGWITCCSAHDDSNPSLSVSEADDGRVLLMCFAKCSTPDIVEAAGLTMPDLFPDKGNEYSNASMSMKPRKPMEKSRFHGQKKSRKPKPVFPAPEQAADVYCRDFGRVTSFWLYLDADRNEVGRVLRWDLADGGKEVRPLRKSDDGWRCEGILEPRPLYRLPALMARDADTSMAAAPTTAADLKPVFVVEGEKAADAACSIGLLATTSAGGCEVPHKTDWSPLAGRDVFIIPDNDVPGRKYAEDVALILISLDVPARVRILDLCDDWPELPEKGDIADWCENFDAVEPETLKQRIEALAERAPLWKPTPPESAVPSFEPFPVEVLPTTVREFVETGAKSIGCDVTYLALPLLSILGAAIGNTRRLRLKTGWEVPPIIWTAVVGMSGSMKTPAWSLAMSCVQTVEQEADRRHAQELARHLERVTEAERRRQLSGKPAKPSEDDDEEPDIGDAPKPTRFSVSDTTVEALAPLLQENPRGLLLSRDELSGWIGSFDKFSKSGRASGDVGHWLTMFNAKPLRVDRKTGEPRTIKVESAAVSVCGGIQPSTFRRAIGREHRENGLLARFLLVWPPTRKKRWTDEGVSSDVVEDMTEVVRKLNGLDFALDRNGEPVAGLVGLSVEAKSLFKAFYDQHAGEQETLDEDLAAAWSKLEEYAARLALIIHLTRFVARESVEAHEVDAESMAAGIALTRWFCVETRRVYALLEQSDVERQRDDLLSWIRRRGRDVSVPDVQGGHRRFKTAAETEAALDELVKAGFGRWQQVASSHRGGRPTRRFILHGEEARP